MPTPIHPGYGFLSENADFAAAVLDAGLTWIGPPVAAVAAMGSKIEAKKMMAAAGVPVLDELDPDTVTADQLPVLIKASAGGGGRGMRVVRELSELPAQVEAARREAQSAFGDPTVFCERYLATGHHVEVQVLADEHGTVWAVGERECSIQRRHQKIIEEAPSPLVERTPGMRAKLFDAARLAATAIGYTGAGTVEFMADDNGDFFFLEMNTRLQVEHPVTEATTGLDLVELQLHVADGGRLDPEPPPSRGYSDRGPLYAEDPAKGWQPQAGTVHRFDVPTTTADSVPLDGSACGSTPASSTARRCRCSTTRCWPRSSPTRRPAARPPALLADALARTRIHGVRTNRDLLVNVLRHPAFLDGATDTAFFDTHGLAELAAPLADPAPSSCRLAAALADAARNRRSRNGIRRRARADGATLGRASRPSSTATPRARAHEVRYRFTRGRRGVARVRRRDAWCRRPTDGWCWPSTAWTARSTWPATATTCSSTPRSARCNWSRCRASPIPTPRSRTARCWRPCRARCCASAPRSATPSPPGQPLIWLEAMKMEHTVTAPGDGVLAELNVEPGPTGRRRRRTRPCGRPRRRSQ